MGVRLGRLFLWMLSSLNRFPSRFRIHSTLRGSAEEGAGSYPIEPRPAGTPLGGRKGLATLGWGTELDEIRAEELWWDVVTDSLEPRIEHRPARADRGSERGGNWCRAALQATSCGRSGLRRGLPGGELIQDRRPNELAQDGVVGDEPGVERHEPLEERQQTLGLDVLECAEGDLSQERFDEGDEGRAFIDQGRVEHHVGVLLKREDVALLAPADRLPSTNGFLGRVSALGGIP